jgi:hypothetical protein
VEGIGVLDGIHAILDFIRKKLKKKGVVPMQHRRHWLNFGNGGGKCHKLSFTPILVVS